MKHFFPTSVALAFKICLKHALIHISFDEDTGFCKSKKLYTVNSAEAKSMMKCSSSSERKILGISVESLEFCNRRNERQDHVATSY